MMALPLIRFVNILLAALLAGASFGIWMGFNPSSYSPDTYLEQQQHLVRSLNTLMVSMVVITTLITLASALMQRSDRSTFIPLLTATACFAACIVISRLGNFPVQQEILTWKPGALPADWTNWRDQWWSFHVWRTQAELAGLALVIWTGIKK